MQSLAAIFMTANLAAGAPLRDAPYCPPSCDQNTIRPSEIPADAPRFSDFPAKAIQVKRPAKPDVYSDPDVRMYRTTIRWSASRGPDFAGRFTLASWGCGTDCSEFAIVDALTGKVFEPLNMLSVESGNIDPLLQDRKQGFVKCRRDSRLLVAIGAPNEDSALRGVSYFVWEGHALKRIRFVPHPFDYEPSSNRA